MARDDRLPTPGASPGARSRAGEDRRGSAGDPDADGGARHGRSRLDVRPLDPLSSIKIKLGVLVASTTTAAAFVLWFTSLYELRKIYVLPIVIIVALAVTQLLARGMTSPLREMTAAASAMAKGDYSIRVTATSRDEVGQLADAFNRMAVDLGSVDLMRREVIANVSHELRTPIAALQAQLENIVDGVDEADPETLKTALAQTERLGRLVTYLLDLSRIEAGAVGLEIGELELDPFLEDVVHQAAMVANAAGRTIHWEVDVHPSTLTVPADGERLHQVLANLCHNAYRHSPENGTVTISARLLYDQVIIDVHDEGPGISPEVREKIFDRFEHGHVQTPMGIPTGGTGLGLSIARWAIDLHGGTIGVIDSEVGATMRIALPVQRPEISWPEFPPTP